MRRKIKEDVLRDSVAFIIQWSMAKAPPTVCSFISNRRVIKRGQISELEYFDQSKTTMLNFV